MNGKPQSNTALGSQAEHHLEQGIACVSEALSDLKFGHVALTVHEGRIVQIDVTEKRRLTAN